MFNDTTNPADHKDHDPARCDYARLWLTQQFVAGTHEQHVEKLSNEQIARVGMMSAVYSQTPETAPLFAEFNLTLEQVYNFSEMLRKVLIVRLGLDGMLGVPQGDPLLN